MENIDGDETPGLIPLRFLLFSVFQRFRFSISALLECF
jgi:hypothetical protein